MDELTARLDDYIVGLRQLQEQEQARVDDLQTRLGAAKGNVARIEKAIRELYGPQAKPQPKPKATRSHVSDGAIERVLQVVVQAPNGVVYDDIIEQTGLSHDPVRKAIQVLRDREEVRRAGVKEGTRKSLFKLMPELIETGTEN
jgi:hypothetical protein